MDERDRWPTPGYQPTPRFQTTSLDSWQDVEEVANPVRGRGSLPGLVLVVGLIGFFIADAATGGPNAGSGDSTQAPGGEPAGPWFIATGVMLVLCYAAAQVALIHRRNRRAASVVDAVEVRARRPLPRRAMAARAFQQTMAVEISPPPRQNRYFLWTVDELLAAADTLSDHHVEEIEEALLRFAASAAPADLGLLVDEWSSPEFRGFVRLADEMTGPQLRYLTVVIEARRGLR